MIHDTWYRNAVIYSLDLESFMDANGDGVGDFDGLMARLDYLDSLGIDTIWLAPFQRTPNQDNGYDIADYYEVDSRHGTVGDFVEFMHHARGRGIRVIMDLVLNHTSDQHEWFQRSRASEDSPWRDWYIWSKDRPEGWDKGMVFPGVQESTWSYDRKARAYYAHRFYKHQPDLNTHNPRVRAAIRRVMGYWLQQGVAGFRLDALPFMLEERKGGDKWEMHYEYLAELRSFQQWRVGDAVLLGEANVAPGETLPYFHGNGTGGIHMMFNFWVNQHLFYALASGDTRPLRDALLATRDIPELAQWAHFLRNHDELDLGRLTEEQRERVFESFGPEEHMQLYHRGIRRRLAPMLGDRPHLELAYSLLFSLPGTPVMRYGDEIGMGDDLSLKERDAVRTPMQWSSERNAGFSDADSTFLPVISEGIWRFERVNVEAQRRDPDSLLNWTGRMIRLRKECPEIGGGRYDVLDPGCDGVLALRYNLGRNSLLIMHNFEHHPHEVSLTLDGIHHDRLTDLLTDETVAVTKSGTATLSLDAYGYRWFRIGPLDYALHRDDVV